jgi:hypothetical protein
VLDRVAARVEAAEESDSLFHRQLVGQFGFLQLHADAFAQA